MRCPRAILSETAASETASFWEPPADGTVRRLARRRRSFLKKPFTRRLHIGSRWAGAWRRSTSRGAHTHTRARGRPFAAAAAAALGWPTPTGACVPNSPPTTHHPSHRRGRWEGILFARRFPGTRRRHAVQQTGAAKNTLPPITAAAAAAAATALLPSRSAAAALRPLLPRAGRRCCWRVNPANDRFNNTWRSIRRRRRYYYCY